MDLKKLRIFVISATVFLLGFVIAFDTLYTFLKESPAEIGYSLEVKEDAKSEKEAEKEAEKEGEKDSDEADELFFENFFLNLSEKVISLNYCAAFSTVSVDFDSYFAEINPPPPKF
ncbi:MAG: hypothetical protein IAF38_02970 [Bacteroidia bacterium]|nr:hypothetical protein [Bacteroidia bacterium]